MFFLTHWHNYKNNNTMESRQGHVVQYRTIEVLVDGVKMRWCNDDGVMTMIQCCDDDDDDMIM